MISSSTLDRQGGGEGVGRERERLEEPTRLRSDRWKHTRFILCHHLMIFHDSAARYENLKVLCILPVGMFWSYIMCDRYVGGSRPG